MKINGMTKFVSIETIIWDKVFTRGPGKICGRQPLKNVTWSNQKYFVPFEIM